jgi:hypothetical protein
MSVIISEVLHIKLSYQKSADTMQAVLSHPEEERSRASML